jgi:hypothetical protein
MDYILHKQAAALLTMIGRACCEYERPTPQGASWRLGAGRNGREAGNRLSNLDNGIEASMSVKLSMFVLRMGVPITSTVLAAKATRQRAMQALPR